MANDGKPAALPWGIDIVKSMFPKSAGGNIDKYFTLIDQAIDRQLGPIANPATAVAPAPVGAAGVNAAGAMAAAAAAGAVAGAAALPSAAAKAAALQKQKEHERIELKLYAFATIAVENTTMKCEDEAVSHFSTVMPKKTKGKAKPVAPPPAPVVGWSFPPGEPHLETTGDHPDEHPVWTETPANHPIDPYRPFGKYDFKKTIGNKGYGMGEMYKGRGFFQLTGLYNYITYGKKAGTPDLYLHPERASQPAIAAEILAAYLLDKKDRILAALAKRDFHKARQAVNSKALSWQKFEKAYETGESKMNGTKPKPPVVKPHAAKGATIKRA